MSLSRVRISATASYIPIIAVYIFYSCRLLLQLHISATAVYAPVRLCCSCTSLLRLYTPLFASVAAAHLCYGCIRPVRLCCSCTSLLRLYTPCSPLLQLHISATAVYIFIISVHYCYSCKSLHYNFIYPYYNCVHLLQL
jgi:hypothetical protein